MSNDNDKRAKDFPEKSKWDALGELPYLQSSAWAAGWNAASELAMSIIASARADAVRPFVEAGLATADGKPRKVMGTLPKTKDGVIVGNHATLWVNDVCDILSFRVDNIGCTDNEEIGAFWEVGECYSTPEAARAALGGEA